MNLKEHRIYQYLSEPVSVAGMTIDELALGLIGLVGGLYCDTFWHKSGFIAVGTVGVFLVKRLKKMTSGFSMGSFLHWHFGFMPNRSPSWPVSWKRFWLS